MLRLIILVLATLAAALPAGAAAPACWDYAAGGWDPAGTLGGPDPARALALTADGRLLAAFPAGVGILDLSDPAAPAFVGFLATEAPVRELAADGDRFVALTDNSTLWYGLLTAGQPPAWGDSLGIDDPVGRIALDGPTATLVIDDRALLTIDVRDPKHLTVGAFVIPPVGVLDLATAQGLAYVGTSLDRFYVYDISDPGTITFVGSPRDGLASGAAIAVDFPTVYAAAGGSIYIYDVSDPAAPVRTGRAESIATYVQRLYPGKGRLYALTDREQAVMFAEVAADSLALLGHAALVDQGRDLVSLGDHLYVAEEANFGEVFDAAAARHPGFDHESVPWRIEAADFHGDHAYAITNDGLDNRRLEVMAFGEAPAVVTTVGTLPTVGAPVRVVAAGSMVAFATSVTDLTLVDVSDPAAPPYLAITSSQTVPRGLVLVGDGAYVANNSLGLVGWDISDPTRPRVTTQITLPRTQKAWSVLGDYILVGMSGDLNGMFVVDCHHPETMRVAAWVAIGPPVVDVLGFDNDAYVADAAGLVHVFNLSDPADPRPRGAVTVGEGAGRLAAYGRHIYYVDSKQGVVALDGIAPDTPVVLGRSLVPLQWATIDARSTGIYLPVGNEVARLPLACGALSAAPVPPPAGPDLVAAPNPFNPRTSLSFRLDRAMPVSLVIHDLRGRRVATLIDGIVLEAGEQHRTWDGRDDAGRAVASGVYLARLQAGDRTARTRLTLVR